jgi:hypothetical protein
MEIEWENPKPLNKIHRRRTYATKHDEFRNALRENPMKWAVFVRGTKTARSVVYSKADRNPEVWKGFEQAVRLMDDGTYTTYVRYTGKTRKPRRRAKKAPVAATPVVATQPAVEMIVKDDSSLDKTVEALDSWGE